ncbi:MAG: hypothetical protein LC641_10635 [Spirochaeta sp.]|nr:hypothetical protein [Spirochaeta sp.]
MKIKVELEMELDLKELNISELKKLIKQVMEPEQSNVIKETRVVDFKIL